LFSDILSPFLKPDEIKGCRVAEIGSGTGKIEYVTGGRRQACDCWSPLAFEVYAEILDSGKGDLSQMIGDQCLLKAI
jgi:hypothetical protein